MVNKVILVGRLGRDPEVRYTGGGKAVANFSLATSEKFKDRNGEKQEKTEWHRCTAWEKLAEIIQQYVKKGSLIYVEGSLQTREWQDKEGIKRKTTEILVRTMKMLGGRPNGGDNDPGGDEEPYHSEPAQRPGNSQSTPEISDEDIPF